MISFREYLKETIDNTRSHYTSIEGLYEILKKGYISGNEYEGNTKNFPYSYSQNTPNKPKELCLIRRGKENNIFKIASRYLDNIKIVFDLDNVANLKGVGKPKPIAEFGVRDLLNTKNWIKEQLQDKNIITQEEGEKIFNFIKNIPSYKVDDFISKKSKRWVNTNFKTKPKNKLEKIWETLITCLAPFDIELFNKREGEERLNLTKSNIPVSSRYMKIILGNDILREISERKIQAEIRMLSYLYKDKKITKEEFEKFMYETKHMSEIKKKKLEETLSLIEQYKKKDPNLFEFKEKI